MRLLLLSLAFSVCSRLGAQGFVEQRLQYPVTVSEGRRVITGFQPFGMQDEQILANAMKWAIVNVCEKGREGLFDINVTKKDFSFNLSLDYVVDGKTKYIYGCKVNIRVMDGKLVYTVYGIQYKASSIVPLSSVTSLDRLTPEKKPKHQEIIKVFQELVSKRINQLLDAVIENKCASITHWSDISIQRAVKGMSEDECTLAFGKPNTAYEDNNGRVQWSYGLNFILIFRQKILETIIR